MSTATKSTAQVARVYTRADLARILGKSERTIDRLAKAGKIPGQVDVGGRAVRFDRATVDRWLLKSQKN